MLNINLTLPIMMALFLLFAVLMNQVFFKPVSRALEARDAYVKKAGETANDALKKVQALQENYDARLKAAHVQAQDAIQAAIKESEGKRLAKLEGVKAEVEQEISSARQAIRAERESAVASLNSEVGAFADLIQRKAMGSSPAFSGNTAGGSQS